MNLTPRFGSWLQGGARHRAPERRVTLFNWILCFPYFADVFNFFNIFKILREIEYLKSQSSDFSSIFALSSPTLVSVWTIQFLSVTSFDPFWDDIFDWVPTNATTAPVKFPGWVSSRRPPLPLPLAAQGQSGAIPLLSDGRWGRCSWWLFLLPLIQPRMQHIKSHWAQPLMIVPDNHSMLWNVRSICYPSLLSFLGETNHVMG